MNSDDYQMIMNAMNVRKDEDLEPYYETVYFVDSIELENPKEIQSNFEINEWDSIKFISNSSLELRADYLNYLQDEYETIYPNTEERLSYLEIATVSRYIIRNYKKDRTTDFSEIFKRADFCLNKGNETTKTLIIIGLFEGIQNTGSWYKVDSKIGFNKWLKNESKKAWSELIKSWEVEK